MAPGRPPESPRLVGRRGGWGGTVFGVLCSRNEVELKMWLTASRQVPRKRVPGRWKWNP